MNESKSEKISWEGLLEAARAETPSLSQSKTEMALEAIRANWLRQEKEDPAEAVAQKEILTTDEVAAFLQVTPEQLGEEIQTMPFFEFAGRLRMRKKTLLEWIEKREKRTQIRLLAAVGEE